MGGDTGREPPREGRRRGGRARADSRGRQSARGCGTELSHPAPMQPARRAGGTIALIGAGRAGAEPREREVAPDSRWRLRREPSDSCLPRACSPFALPRSLPVHQTCSSPALLRRAPYRRSSHHYRRRRSDRATTAAAATAAACPRPGPRRDPMRLGGRPMLLDLIGGVDGHVGSTRSYLPSRW